MSRFCYSALQSDFGSIRLLRLLPHRDEAADIQCDLFDYSLQDSYGTHLYEALSYVWGDPEKTLPIFVHGHRFDVTVNLHAALSHLRNHSIERVLWIDAICINQSDDKEKENQIQIMARIYGQANRVVVWLGGAANDSDLAFEEIRSAKGREPDYRPPDDNLTSAISFLLQRPWFRRIWILQEVAAARSILIMCGSKKIDGFVFCLGIDSLAVSYPTHIHIQNLIFSSTYLIREALFRTDYSPNNQSGSSLNVCSLGGLIDMYHAREATKLHDKVYALLGMSSDDLSKADLLPNYGVPWETVFQRIIRYFLPESISIETWEDKEIAVVQSEGYLLGRVSAVQKSQDRGDRQSVQVSLVSLPGGLMQTLEAENTWTFQIPAKTVRKGDLICLFQGASRPSIIRLYKDYFTIIMISVPLSEEREKRRETIQWPMHSLSSALPSRDFLLVWNWGNSSPENTKPKEITKAGGYETWLQMSQWGEEYSELETDSHLSRAVRAWSLMLILGDVSSVWDPMIPWKLEAEKWGRKAIRHFDVAILEERLLTRNDETSLVRAREGNHTSAVDVLLMCNHVAQDFDDRQYKVMPLLWALQEKNEAVVEQLLNSGNLDIKKTNRDESTPSWWEVKGGRDTLVQLLLNTREVEVDFEDTQPYDTPLHCAATLGHEAVVQLLLDIGDFDVDLKNGRTERTSLSLAAEGGHEIVVELLLKTGKVDVDSRDQHGRSPLWWAARTGRKNVFQLLLDTGKVDVNLQDSESQTPLSAAVEGSHEAVFELLLKTGMVEVDSKDRYGRTPLWWAARTGHEKIVQLLLDTGKVNADPRLLEWYPQGTALYSAVLYGHKTVVGLLLNTGKVDVNCKGLGRFTPLSVAAKLGNLAMAELLFKTGKVEVNLVDSYGSGPLHFAAQTGREAVVKLLLTAEDINVNMKDSEGRTPLSQAAVNGHEAVVKLLLMVDNIDVNVKDKYEQTPLSMARKNGHEAVAKLLRDYKDNSSRLSEKTVLVKCEDVAEPL